MRDIGDEIVNETKLDQIITLLERIALAIESQALQPAEAVKTAQQRTEFPWDAVSARCYKWLRAAVESDSKNYFNGKSWPLSCEDLFELGFRYLTSHIYVRNWSVVSAKEIAAVLKTLGFDGWEKT